MILGFEDTSPEELRYEAYETQKSGNIAVYVSTLHSFVVNSDEGYSIFICTVFSLSFFLFVKWDIFVCFEICNKQKTFSKKKVRADFMNNVLAFPNISCWSPEMCALKTFMP